MCCFFAACCLRLKTQQELDSVQMKTLNKCAAFLCFSCLMKTKSLSTLSLNQNNRNNLTSFCAIQHLKASLICVKV